VVVCSSLLAWLACRGRQPVIVAYFLCGVLLALAGFRRVAAVEVMDHLARFGVTLLLFLAGLVLHPDRLLTFFRTAFLVTLVKSVLGWVLVFAFLLAWGFGVRDSSIAAVALMFSSTILVIKLLPTTTLHQKRMGSICIAILIAEDLLAVVFLLFVGSAGDATLPQMFLVPVKALLLGLLAVFGEQFVVRRMMRSADRYNEVLIMLCLGWCVGIATLAYQIGVPYEVGAFVAGLAMARGKIAPVLSEQLKPIRDFFLMFFFFVLGATFDVSQLRAVWLPALCATALIVVSRPLSLRWLFRRMGEEPGFAGEMGLRLGQASEFALIIATAAAMSGHLSAAVAQLVQLTTVATMLISSYTVVLKCPTPIGVEPGLQRD
jgi:Kef-type K+ transport system membrane component KefB